MKKVLKFHTGRVGRFFNAGHITFVDFQNIDKGGTFANLFLSDDEKICRDASGNEIDFEINPDGTGYVNEDHDYDTTTSVLEDDLTVPQIEALIRAKETYFMPEYIEDILQNYYEEYV